MAKTVRLNGGGSLRINLDKLKTIEAELQKRYVTRVGILGDKAHNRKQTVETKTGKRRPGKEPAAVTNAEIGLVHEKGSISRGIPRRSFLLMPLEQKFDKYIGAISASIMQGITTENVKMVYLKMGVFAESLIQRAFATRGFGKWAPNKPATIARKGSDSPLIDTAQLRKSITSTVVTV